MKATHTPEKLLGSRSKLGVLRVLWRSHDPLNASQIASRTGLTRPAVSSALLDLNQAGAVRSSPAGRAIVHSLERGNIYVERWIEPVFRSEWELPDVLLEEIEHTFSNLAVSGVMFGSYARGQQTSDSDIDLVLVAADSRSKRAIERLLESYLSEFRVRWGAPLSAVTYDQNEANTLRSRAPSLAASLMDEGITVFGSGPADWVEDD